MDRIIPSTSSIHLAMSISHMKCPGRSLHVKERYYWSMLSQGIQAQTISNLYLAIEHDLEIIPILNKIDMESAMIEEVSDQIIDLIGCH